MPTTLSGQNTATPLNLNLTEHDFNLIRTFLSSQCGIMLNDSKHYLVMNRLGGLLAKFGLKSFSELGLALQSSASQQLATAVIDAMTTNETYWFRDEQHFAVLRETILPELWAEKKRSLKIWSAACSSGQEPYSISMTAIAARQDYASPHTVQILGTDIATTIIHEARQASYSEQALARGMAQATQQRYFHNTATGYQLSHEVTQSVRFEQFNLLKPYTMLGNFDIIFCRNVLIYFADSVKFDIITRMAAILEPGGYLFLSSTETMPIGLKGFVRHAERGVSCFRKEG